MYWVSPRICSRTLMLEERASEHPARIISIAIACCIRILLTCALLMMALHSEGRRLDLERIHQQRAGADAAAVGVARAVQRHGAAPGVAGQDGERPPRQPARVWCHQARVWYVHTNLVFVFVCLERSRPHQCLLSLSLAVVLSPFIQSFIPFIC